jgi:hypothetical protein
MITALLDRLTHYCHLLETGSESYRFRQSSHTAKARIKFRKQAGHAPGVLTDTTLIGIESPPASGGNCRPLALVNFFVEHHWSVFGAPTSAEEDIFGRGAVPGRPLLHVPRSFD